MIEFNGRIDGECLKFMLKKSRKIERICMAVVGIIIMLPFIIGFKYMYPLIAIGGILFGLGWGTIGFWPLSEKGINNTFCSRVYYDPKDEAMVFVYNDGKESFFMVADVETVEDYGDWYCFAFANGPSPFYVCQKKFAVGNTIEEFEKLFEGKIVKMNEPEEEETNEE